MMILSKLGKSVHKKWEQDFADLFSGDQISSNFPREACALIDELERNMVQDEYSSNIMLNSDISLEEVRAAIHKSKVRKAVGVEEIPNEVLKSLSLLNVLFCLFQFCINYNIVPSVWYKSIIKPIPKSSKNYPRVPSNYRGISSLSTVYRLYSSLLNAQLTQYIEAVENLVGEQNGLRKNRACIDHIYSVSTIVRTRLSISRYICMFRRFPKSF